MMNLTQTVEAIRTKRVSSAEVVQECLGRIQELDGRLGAFLWVDPERALAEAEKIDRALASGKPVGPLAGASRGRLFPPGAPGGLNRAVRLAARNRKKESSKRRGVRRECLPGGLTSARSSRAGHAAHSARRWGVCADAIPLHRSGGSGTPPSSLRPYRAHPGDIAYTTSCSYHRPLSWQTVPIS